ncbi:MAG: alpha/beta hydrolase [Bacteroidetes bacterium]|nr:alpha/beta hydrolase [Bacteroidota bacterium]
MSFKIQQEDKFKYVECGEGDIIVLLHGLFGALSNFRDLINYFKSNYKVVIPLLPLYDLPIRETTVDGLVEYVLDFIDHKGYKDVSYIGNSLGGHVGLICTLQKQELVKSLTLTGSSGLFEKAFGDTFPKRGSYDFIKEKTETTFYDPKVATKELVDEVFEIVNNREKALRVLSMAKSAIRHNMRDELKNIHVPVCLIWGKNDIITPDFVAEEFNERLPNASLAFIDKCGHAPMMEHPEQFNEHLEHFLRLL